MRAGSIRRTAPMPTWLLDRLRMLTKAALTATLVVKLLVLNAVLTIDAFPARRASVTATLALALLCLLPAQALRKRLRLPALLVINAVISTILLADWMHFRFFGDPLSLAEVRHGWQLGAV